MMSLMKTKPLESRPVSAFVRHFFSYTLLFKSSLLLLVCLYFCRISGPVHPIKVLSFHTCSSFFPCALPLALLQVCLFTSQQLKGTFPQINTSVETLKSRDTLSEVGEEHHCVGMIDKEHGFHWPGVSSLITAY